METNKTYCYCEICKKGEIVEKLKMETLEKSSIPVIGDLGRSQVIHVHENYHCNHCGLIYEATENNGLLEYEKTKTNKNPA